MGRLVVNKSVVKAYSAHVEKWRNCTACPLHATAYQKVFARGHLPAQIMFLGEAPGACEDDSGSPFVGESGAILDFIIDDSIETFNKRLALEESNVIGGSEAMKQHIAWAAGRQLRYAITNTVLCRPDTNDKGHQLPPERDEMIACSGRLAEFIGICNPKLVVLVGRKADVGWIRVMGKIPNFIRTLSIEHPSYMLRQENPDDHKRRAACNLHSALFNIFNPNAPKEEEEDVPF